MLRDQIYWFVFISCFFQFYFYLSLMIFSFKYLSIYLITCISSCFVKKNIQPRAEEIGSVYPIPDTGQAVHCE